MRDRNRTKLQNQAKSEFLSGNTTRFGGSEVLVFVPVHNEELIITKVVEDIRKSCSFDLLVIDDGSTDNTPHILCQMKVEVLKHPAPLGSQRIIDGLKMAYALGCKYVIKIDGDGQHNTNDIPRLYKHAIKAEADIVIGSRHLHAFNANILTIKGFGMWLCSKLVFLLTGKRITDTTSGLKIWSRKACEVAIEAFQNGKLKDASTFHIEELIIAAKKKLRVEEIAVTMYPRKYGNTKSYSLRKLGSFPINLIRAVIRALI